MAKRMQEQKEEDRIVAKSQPTAMNLTQLFDKFLIREPSDCVEKAWGYSKHLQGNLTQGQEEVQNPTQRRDLKMAERCIPWQVDG